MIGILSWFSHENWCVHHRKGGFIVRNADLTWFYQTKVWCDSPFSWQKRPWKHMTFTYFYHHKYFFKPKIHGDFTRKMLGSSPPGSPPASQGPQGSLGPRGRQVSPFWSGSRLPSAPASRKTWSSCAANVAKGWGWIGLAVRGFGEVMNHQI